MFVCYGISKTEKVIIDKATIFKFPGLQFVCPDWTVEGRNKNKVGSCVLFFIFFIKNRVGGQKK